MSEKDDRTPGELPPGGQTHEESVSASGPLSGEPERLIGRILGNQYRLDRHIGAGGFGDVFRATQRKTGQLVALKVLRPRTGKNAPSMERQLARFRREMRACAELHHPHIVRLIDSGETDDGLLFSVFEFVPGETLAAILQQQGALPINTAIDLMSQVLDALGAAHRQGIIHRDLKPNNIMASTSGLRPQVTVLDFGISAFLEGSIIDDFRNLTMTREILGTPAYAAPEQLRGETPSSKSDLYAWGLVFAECILGRPIFNGPTPMEIAHRQLSSEPVVLPERLHQDRLGTILRWVLEKDVTRRAGDAALVLERLLEKRSYRELVDTHGYFIESDSDPPPVKQPTPGSLSEVRTADLPMEERRQVTALCCVMSIGAVAAETPSEEVDQALQETHALCMRIASRFGVEVAAGFGGQLLMYFGLPRASDTDARRAAVAALEIAHEIRRQNEHSAIRIDFRIGIHTGMVTANRSASAAATFGVTPDEAARLAREAPVNGIAVSDATLPHLRTAFEFRIDPASGGGKVHQLVAESRADSTGSGGRRGPFVGRTQELDAIKSAWERARGGQGGAALIVGEPGMGKSRLVRELRQAVEGIESRWVSARCLPEAQHSPLRPISDLLTEEFDLGRAGEDRLKQLERALDELGVARPDAKALLCPWLGLGPVEPLPLSPQKQKELLVELLVDLLIALVERRSTPLLIEDLHWADPSTRELVDRLVERAPAARCLVIMTARPEVEIDLSDDLVTVIPLVGLRRPEVERIVRELVGREFLSGGLLAKVVDRAGGNPFFVEELTHYLVQSSSQPTLAGGRLEDVTTSSAVPTKLRDILAGRLDRLGPAKETAQVAAAI
ncbi:MAG TPA: protein kinase, partial [Polyangia bacterium]|nr:protein kinase [Polyangia bacterium]